MLPNQGESLAEIAKKLFPCAETTGNGSNSNNDVRRIRQTIRHNLRRMFRSLRLTQGSVSPAVPPALCRRDEIPDLRERFRQKFHVRMPSAQPDDDFPRVPNDSARYRE